MTPPKWLGRVALAGLLGILTALGFAPTSFLLSEVLGVAGFIYLLSRSSIRGSFALGLAYGVGLLGVLVNWVYVIAWPLPFALVGFQALYYGVLAVGLVLVRRLPAAPLWLASVWVAGEAALAHFPFGGFGWSRLGFTVADSPLKGYLPVLGVTGASWVFVLFCALLATSITREQIRYWRVLLALVVFVLGWPLSGVSFGPATGQVNVGVVQGNVDGVGLGAFGRERSVTNNHISETITLMAKARTGQTPMPDFVLWPESSTDLDPFLDRVTARGIEYATQITETPIFVGAATQGPNPDERQTSAIWWQTDQQTGPQYHKSNLVPFGEYIPFRDILLPRIPLLRLTGRQGVPGTEPAMVAAVVPDRGQLDLGVAICFDLAYDQTMRQAGTGRMITVLSNNATYVETPQIYQQLEITRTRAIEANRSVAVATTNALSGVISNTGEVLWQGVPQRSGSVTMTMPLRNQTTPAIKYGAGFDISAVTLGLLAIVAGLARSARYHRRQATKEKQ